MRDMTERRKGKSKSVKSTTSKSVQGASEVEDNESQSASYSPIQQSPSRTPPPPPSTAPTAKIDLRKEYNRFCKLYSSEPLDIVAGPLEKASYRGDDDSVELDLKGRGLRGVDCIALGKILATNSTIYHLNLSDCLLLPQGFQALLDGLGKNSHLQVLELRGNNIQSGMVENLATFLRLNHTVKKLLLEWNCLGTTKSTFELFCNALGVNKGLEHVDLKNNQIGDISGINIAGMLKQNNSLLSLDLRWNSLGIQGAKAIWDALQYHNNKMTKIELCGNFVPEEIVRHIQNTLSQRCEKEAIIEDFSKRTTILTRQLQKTEDEYQSEIQSMVSAFEDEEEEFKRRIREGQQNISRLEKELDNERIAKKSLQKEINELQGKLQEYSEKELVLREALQIKSDQICKLEQALKSLGEELGQNFEMKIEKTTNDLASLEGENDRLNQSLKESLATVKEKESEILILNNRIESYKQNSKRSEELFEERLRKEKENWLNWKVEVESNEHQETRRLEVQLLDLQRNMQDHVKSLEEKRAQAEEEVNRLKILLLTARTEAEENLCRLRNSLNEEHIQATHGLSAQIDSLKNTSDALESEGKRLDSVIRKLESDNGALERQNDHLRQHNTNLEEELEETKNKTHLSILKYKNEVKELQDLMAKEEQGNKILRGQVLEMQEQIAVLTMKLNRAEKERQSEAEYWKVQLERRDDELKRLKEEDMRRASLLHDAFIVYMRSTSAATGIPYNPSSPSQTDLHRNNILNNIKSDVGAKGDNNKEDNV